MSSVTYRRESELLDANPNLWTEDSALIKLGNIMTVLGGKYYSFYPSYFAEKWTYKTEFKSDMINKLEHFFTFSKGISSMTRFLAIKALNEYQIGRGFKTRKTAVNNLEFDLIRAMQVAISNELGKYIGVSELSTIFKGWDGYFRRIIHHSERNNIGARTLNQIIKMIGDQITYNHKGKTINFQLRDENLEIITDAIKVYRDVRLNDLKYKYVVPLDAPNKQDMLIIELLRLGYSKQPLYNPSGKEITYGKLYTILKKDYYQVYNNKYHFSLKSVEYILDRISKDLLDLFAPEEYNLLTTELSSYKPNVVTPVSTATSYFGVNLDNFKDNIGKDQLSNLFNYLKYAKSLSGQYPAEVLRFSLNHRKDTQRISNFAEQFTGIESEAKKDFVKSLTSTNYLSIDNGRIISGSRGIPAPIVDLVKFSKSTDYTGKALNIKSKTATHQAVLRKIMENSKYAIASELVVWTKKGSKLLKGHIDLVLAIGDTIFVCDYKPLQTPYITSRISDNFINVIPQVSSYGLLLKKNFNIKKLYCVIFNEKGVWIYEPDSILNKVNNFMIQQGTGNKIIWDFYF